MHKTFVIAEAGVNHNGDEALAVELVEIAARAGADAVKFQTFLADKMVTQGTAKAAYQQRETGDGDQHSMLKALELSHAAHARLLQRCAQLGIEFMSTPFDLESADMLLSLGMHRIKIPSGEITNLPFLHALAQKGKPLILSTGMATMDEIETAVKVIAEARAGANLMAPLSDNLTILHCTSNYPAALSDVHLLAMNSIRARTGLPVGYSDHTMGIVTSIAATAMGASVIEKHFTLDRNLEGPDHKASLTPPELEQMIRSIRDVGLALGSDIKQPTESELPVRELVRRSVTTARPVKAGQAITQDDVCLLRPGHGIQPADLTTVLGKSAARDLPAGTSLQWSDLG